MADITSRRKLSAKWNPQLINIVWLSIRKTATILGIDTVVGYRDQMKALVLGIDTVVGYRDQMKALV